MIFTVDVLPELWAPKNMVRLMSKRLCFRIPIDRQHGKWVQTLLQSERQHPLQYLLINV